MIKYRLDAIIFRVGRDPSGSATIILWYNKEGGWQYWDFGKKRLLRDFGGFRHMPAYLGVVLIIFAKCRARAHILSAPARKG